VGRLSGEISEAVRYQAFLRASFLATGVSSTALAAPLALTSTQALGLGGGVALWLALGVGAIIFAAKARAKSDDTKAWATKIYQLLESAPQCYAILRADGSLQTSDKVRGWLELPRKLERSADLEASFSASDYQLIKNDLIALQQHGSGFNRALHTLSGRLLFIQGRRAEAQSILWISDVQEPLAIGSAFSTERSEILADLNAATAILEAAPFPIWHRNADLKLRHVNSAYVKIAGGQSALETINEGRDIFPHGGGENAASIVVEGVRRSLQVFEVPIGSDGVGGFALDVTDREEQAAALARFSEAQRDTLDMLSAPVAIFGRDQKLMFHNLAFSRLFKLAPEWLAEKPRHGDILENLRDARLVPEQSDFAKWKHGVLERYTNLLKPEDELWHLPNESTLRVVTQPHPQGGLQLLFEDVTPRLVLERSYNTLFQVQQATLNNLHEGAIVFHTNGTLSLTNAALARLWHCDPGSFDAGLRVTKWLEKIAPHLQDQADAKVLEQAILTVIVERRSSTGTLLCADDTSLTYVGVPLPDGSALITFLDVSDSIRIQRALEDRNEALETGDKLKTAFLENMSYQLRTPLQNILGFTEMLDQGYFGSLTPKQASYLKDILGETKKLDGLIQDVLELTVSDVGTVLLDIELVPLQKMLEELISDVREISLTKKIALSLEYTSDIGSVKADARRLKLALNKIINNALEFTPAHGTVTITATSTPDTVTLKITDTGRGISVSDQSTIFESFRKGENAKGTKGLGLGLALSRHLITLHGGTIALASELGRGTTIEVALPRKGPDARNG
jgi:signal transduction histidine kinase